MLLRSTPSKARTASRQSPSGSRQDEGAEGSEASKNSSPEAKTRPPSGRSPIPIWHSIAAFNVIAEAVGAPIVTSNEIAQLSRHEPRLDAPTASDLVEDPSFGRRIFLRRHAGAARLTIFDGAHEGLPTAQIAWFEAHPGR